jgi:hypothetical protein
MNNCCYKIEVSNSDILIVSFAGNAKLFGGVQKYEFVHFLNTYFPNISKHFYIDEYCDVYHKGLMGITNNIDETVEYLENEIKNYKKVIFLGNSAGGYASILFGSLLKISTVIAFIPLTIRYKQNVDEKYRDISSYINNSTNYYIYGDTNITDKNDCHHIYQCERISHHCNVFLTKMKDVNLRKMRDNGILIQIIEKIVNSIE